MFPRIETITDILPHIKDQKDIRVKVKDNGFTIICYMMQEKRSAVTTAHLHWNAVASLSVPMGRSPPGRCKSSSMLVRLLNLPQKKSLGKCLSRDDQARWEHGYPVLGELETHLQDPEGIHEP